MRSQNRNYKPKGTSFWDSAGKGSCVLLLLLALLAINPIGGLSAFAEESAEDTAFAESEKNSGVAGVGESDIEPYATTASTVNIAFSPTSANGVVTPIDATGAKAKVDVTATVRVQNSGGYSVYVGSSSSQLKAGSNVIDSVASSTTYENMPINRWGYSFAKGSTASNTYNAMPATLRGSALDSNTSTNIKDETRTYTLSFAANIGADKPAGTYTNQVTMSVVSSPLEVTGLTSLTDMQGMTSDICAASTVGDTIQLKDTRDGKYYWVSKLGDGNCWMTQNLDLDLSTTKALTSADSDVTANYTPAYNTATTASSSTIENVTTAQRSWSLGNYRITNPNTSSNCGSQKNSAADCPSQFTAYTTPTSQNGDENAHYILGNHYQWNTATAGTGGIITSGTASSSICPKGWRLPTSAEHTSLVTALGGTSSTNNVTQAPFYGVRGGSVNQSTDYLFRYAGDYGTYWSSDPNTPGTSVGRAYGLVFWSTTTVLPSTLIYDRQYGLSVRCVAR